ncbi:Ig heavy chain Mem5-like isoform X2 [Mustelus asterias]
MSFLRICTLFHLFQVTVSQATLSQSPPVQTLPAGSPVNLSCRIQGQAASYVHWYRQRERNDMDLVYTAFQNSRTEGRFSSEISEKAGICSLIIADSQKNDSGMYYCAIPNYQNMVQIFGNGSKLVITAGSPTIFLLTPPLDEIPAMERVPLLCLVRGVSPDSFAVRWNVSGRDTEGQSDSGTLEPDGTYTIRSYISLSVETWRSGTHCTYAVQVNSGESILIESVSSQRDSPSPTTCHLLFPGGLSAAALLLLGLVLVAGRRICRNRQKDTLRSPSLQ